MMKADSKKIEWLLQNAKQYHISKETGVAQSALSTILSGKRKIENLTLATSSKLTEYAEKLMKEKKKEERKKNKQQAQEN